MKLDIEVEDLARPFSPNIGDCGRGYRLPSSTIAKLIPQIESAGFTKYETPGMGDNPLGIVCYDVNKNPDGWRWIGYEKRTGPDSGMIIAFEQQERGY
jgi:hypothetical protein